MPVSPLPDAALPPIVSEQDWRAAYETVLAREKEHTRAGDALAAERRKMPMTAVPKDYRFVGPEGEIGLLDMFAGRRQLIVYRFFYEPGVDGWPDRACPGCSFIADHVPHLEHLNERDTTFALVSPADQDRIAALKTTMRWNWEWHVPWYTLLGDDFAHDFDVSEWFGFNVFLRDDHDHVYRTYFVNGRGAELVTPTLSLLDLTPLGRQEDWEDTPAGRPQGPAYRGRRNDEYESG